MYVNTATYCSQSSLLQIRDKISVDRAAYYVCVIKKLPIEFSSMYKW
jgi:hypothetical protein